MEKKRSFTGSIHGVRNRRPENMSTDKTLVINYVRQEVQFEVVFVWDKDKHGRNKDAYYVKFKVSFNNITLSLMVYFGFSFQRGDNILIFPLNSYINGLDK
jgi:hypothetical protein